jgi:hypothetical protein
VSWDVLIMRVPDGVKRAADLPEDFDHRLGTSAEVRSRLLEIFPRLDLCDPARGYLEGDHYSIVFSLGSEDPCEAIMLHVRGGEGSVAPVETLCRATGWGAFDTTESEFIDFEAPDSGKGFDAWRAFRDRVSPEAPEKGVSVGLTKRKD